jgi:hypothetical protein
MVIGVFGEQFHVNHWSGFEHTLRTFTLTAFTPRMDTWLKFVHTDEVCSHYVNEQIYIVLRTSC